MILVDTSVWIDHLRRRDEVLVELLGEGKVLSHPFVIGELALGSLHQRDAILGWLRRLPSASMAHDSEVMLLIERQPLFGLGTGYVDAHLLTAARLTPDTLLWTRDKRLLAIAERLSLAARLAH
ncbi:MAG: type II toxin-antitoxin system VapC family toxin [Acetobacteraceae bacterium]